MSFTVELSDLAGQISNYTFAYLLTVDDDQRPRAVGVLPVLDGRSLLLGEQGNRTLANVAARQNVSLLWPPTTPSGHSLIVDGEATVAGKVVTFTPSNAILHRPVAPA